MTRHFSFLMAGLLSVLLSPAAVWAETGSPPELDSPFLQQSLPPLSSGQDSGDFWQAVRAQGGAPLVEPVDGAPGERWVTFLWRGQEGGVRVVSSPSGDHDPMLQWGDSDIWYRSYRLPDRTRMAYQLAPAVAGLDPDKPEQRHAAIRQTAQTDPLNPVHYAGHTVVAARQALQPRSALILAGAPPQPWVEPRAQGPGRETDRHAFASEALGNTRDITLYRTADWRQGQPGQALLLVFDAHAYAGMVPTILDNLRADGLIPPMAAVFIENPDIRARGRELPPNPEFQVFLTQELMPWLRDTQGVWTAADATVISGSSYGGLASLYAGLQHPEWFGNVLSMSGSFWWAPQAPAGEAQPEPGWMMRLVEEMPAQPVRIYHDAGLFEQSSRRPADILGTNRIMQQALAAKGYRSHYSEFAGGHDYLQWQGSIACGLLNLLADAGTPQAGEQVAEAWQRACAAR
ncbi:DUF3327 domain-containing protein [Alcaligenaceae bacterium SJ-26]|nr:DUF3327 domain-containing protein [Alcaligenaceae bacterium SJ-26]